MGHPKEGSAHEETGVMWGFCILFVRITAVFMKRILILFLYLSNEQSISLVSLLFYRLQHSGFLGKDVGKTMSNTKKMVKWGLLINDNRVVITIKHSILSHKKVIWYNDEIIKETKQFLTGDFDYAWSKDKHIFKIVITKDKEGYGYCTEWMVM